MSFDASIPVEDRVEIHELYARYGHAADACDGEGYSQCFTRDGTFVPSIREGAGTLHAGRAALAAFISDPARHGRTDRHWINGIVLQRDGETIRGFCSAMLIDAAKAGEPRIAASVVYHDVIVREDGRWRFRERRPKRDGA